MKQQRLAWVDSLRGLAIVLMIIYHGVFDWVLFGDGSYFWLERVWILGRIAVVLFLVLAGFSLGLLREKFSGYTKSWRWKNYERGLFFIGLGTIITTITFFLMGDVYVRFGVLHLIGLSIMLVVWLRRLLGVVSLWVWILLGAGWLLFIPACIPQEWLLIVGVPPCGFRSIDYYPILPWISIVALGLWLTEVNWFSYSRKWTWTLGREMEWLGRHSLVLYLVHQPILLSLGWLISRYYEKASGIL